MIDVVVDRSCGRLVGRELDLTFVAATVLGFSIASSAAATTLNPEPPTSIPIPAGVFLVGDPEAVCGSTIREVTLTSDFQLGTTEVTNAQYLVALQWAYDTGLVEVVDGEVFDLLGDTALLLEMNSPLSEITFDGSTFGLREAPFTLIDAYPEGYDPTDHPVKRITWFGAASYCDWLNLANALPLAYDHIDWTCNGGDPYGAFGYRLPTDVEWERAARFDDGRDYPWGEVTADCSYANFFPDEGACQLWTQPAGSHPLGESALGLLDLSGNVGEWCNDWHECIAPEGAVVDPVGPESGTKKILHGGGFFYGPRYVRCGTRDADPPTLPLQAAGFRIARTVPETSDVLVTLGELGELGDRAAWRLSPNPVRAGKSIRLHIDPAGGLGGAGGPDGPGGPDRQHSLLIYDAAGRLVDQVALGALDPFALSTSHEALDIPLDTRDLSPGLHFARIVNETGSNVASTRLVVLR